ncbi:retrovirus-related Pol polyprotein from transposon 412 [Trichonephila clavipes]|uniref:Retrovirus-related Pol polyprotein from transposon 412 n=1 Tax=Trichonephila clavipes TaxID=2585209 RepID=A0A8X6SAJ1_TRICX|nr:retrovirus-related Pol polyprotein from transposon 412 [Trichonephila clavipes]
MKDKAKPLTAFVTHSGHYQWKVMPFGMKNAGSTFQKSMDNALLLHRKYCHSYINDVAIYSTTWDEHLDHIAKVFKVIVLPLTNLTKKNIPKDIPWESSTQDSFVRLKEELVKMPSLHTPDLSNPFLLFADASATAIGVCLAQHNDHMEEMPISFFSKKLTLSQMKWSTIEPEAFSMLEALCKFDTRIFGSQIQVISDHEPLTYLTNSAPHSAKLTRWALALQRYNVKVSYRKGSAHGNADALSRLRISEQGASSSDRCFSNGGRSKTPLNHPARSAV